MNPSHQRSATLTMTTPRIALPQRAPATPTLFAGLLALLSAWLHRSRSRHDLASLDEHMLRDIGLTRFQVEIESTKPFWRI